MDRIAYINPEVVVVKYDKLDDVQVLIFVDKRVPHGTSPTAALGWSAGRLQDNERENSHIFGAGIGDPH